MAAASDRKTVYFYFMLQYNSKIWYLTYLLISNRKHKTGSVLLARLSPGGVAQSVAHLPQEPEILGSVPSPPTYFRFSLLRFKKGSCQLLAKICALSTGLLRKRSKPAQE